MTTDPTSTSQPDNLVEQLLDVAVYLPVGLYLDSKGRVEEIIDRGRAHTTSQVTLARMIGQFAVTFGRKELERRMAGRFSSAADPSEASRPAPGAPGPVAPATTGSPIRPKPARSSSTRSRAAAAKPVTSARPASSGATALGIDGYDTLAASQVIARLDGLTARQLAAVGRHEAQNRNRKTILGRVEQLTTR